jgi:ABC-type transporter Mla MlaB component
MSQGKSGQERRRRPRVKLGGGVVAKVQTVLHAPVIDLSLTGALVEVEEALRPGARCTVRIPISDAQTLRLGARVVRSTLVALARKGEGGRAARYQAAVEFVDVSAEDSATLAAYLDTLDGAVAAEISTESPGEPAGVA